MRSTDRDAVALCGVLLKCCLDPCTHQLVTVVEQTIDESARLGVILSLAPEQLQHLADTLALAAYTQVT